MNGSTAQALVKGKYVRRRIHFMAQKRDWGRMRPATCFRIIGLPEAGIFPITARTFEAARALWIRSSVEARANGDHEREVAINVAWQHLKNWHCRVCGGLKKRTRNESCGWQCATKARASAIRRRNGPIIVRLDRNGRGLTGRSYRGHALRQAQVTVLKNALDRNNQNVAATARDLRMSYGTLKYYIRKFGGYHHAPISEAGLSTINA
jgi:hypothetical protein